MKRMIFAWTLCLVLLLAACSQDAAVPETDAAGVQESAALDAVFSETGVTAPQGTSAQGTKLTVTSGGTYRLSGLCSDGQIYVAAGKNDQVTLVLDGLDLRSSTSPLVVEQAGLVTLLLEEGTENALSDGTDYNMTVDGSKVDGVVFSKADLVLTGAGSLTVTGNHAHGIVSKDTLEITGGVYQITTVKSGVDGKDYLKVDGAVINIVSGTDGLKSSNDQDTDLGYVLIQSGEITIDAGDNGVQAERALTVEGGSITVLGSEEALEGATVTINGGTLKLTSRDDGINGAGAPDSAVSGMASDPTAMVEINGGYIVIDAEGDGVDSNGDLTMTGGILLVNGPTHNDDGALDYAGEAVISGGVVMAVGSSGMAVSFGQSSTQGVIAVNLPQQSGGQTLALCGEDSQILAAFTPTKSYSHLVVSAPAIAAGSTYTVCTGSLDGGDENGYAAGGVLDSAEILATVTMDGLNYGSGSFSGGPGGFHGGMKGERPGGELPEMPELPIDGKGPGGRGDVELPVVPDIPAGSERPELPESFDGAQIPAPPEGEAPPDAA